MNKGETLSIVRSSEANDEIRNWLAIFASKPETDVLHSGLNILLVWSGARTSTLIEESMEDFDLLTHFMNYLNSLKPNADFLTFVYDHETMGVRPLVYNKKLLESNVLSKYGFSIVEDLKEGLKLAETGEILGSCLDFVCPGHMATVASIAIDFGVFQDDQYIVTISTQICSQETWDNHKKEYTRELYRRLEIFKTILTPYGYSDIRLTSVRSEAQTGYVSGREVEVRLLTPM